MKDLIFPKIDPISRNLAEIFIPIFRWNQSAPMARGAPAGQRHLRGSGGVTPRKFWISRWNLVHSERFWPSFSQFLYFKK